MHPGEMGSAVGACLRGAGHHVVWVSGGRSSASRDRAERAGLDEGSTLEEVLSSVRSVISICPPHGAVDLASEVTSAGFAGTYVDANAVSPSTSRLIRTMVEGGGGSYVDGGIIGPPPMLPGTTRLYVCGDEAAETAELFSGSCLDAHAIDAPVGAASALKMAYAAWTKGSIALLSAVLAVAQREDVGAHLRDEWVISQPGWQRRIDQAASSAPKAWRWVAEMEEIADTFADAGMPEGFHRSAAEMFQRLAGFKGAEEVSIEELLKVLTDETRASGGVL